MHMKIKIAIASQTQLYKSDAVEEFILISFQTIKQADKKNQELCAHLRGQFQLNLA